MLSRLQEDPPEQSTLELLQAQVDRVTEDPLTGAAVVVGACLLAGVTLQLFLMGMVRFTRRTRFDLDDLLVRALHAPVILSLGLLGLYLAAGQLEVAADALLLTGRVLGTLAVLLWTRAVLRVSNLLLRIASERADTLPLIEKRTYPLFSNLTLILVLGGSLYALLQVWDADITAWAASAGVLGIAFGFAAKDTLGNLFSGVFIVADAPYQLGDYIVLDDGVRGEIVHIGLRSTRMQTRDDVHITIPNSVIAASKIVNQSGGGETYMRVRAQVSIGYDADIDRARAVLEEIAEAEELVLPSPEPRVRFRRLGESGLDFELMGWVKDPTQRGRAIDGLNTAIIKRFREEEIEIPFPQRVVHLRQE